MWYPHCLLPTIYCSSPAADSPSPHTQNEATFHPGASGMTMSFYDLSLSPAGSPPAGSPPAFAMSSVITSFRKQPVPSPGCLQSLLSETLETPPHPACPRPYGFPPHSRLEPPWGVLTQQHLRDIQPTSGCGTVPLRLAEMLLIKAWPHTSVHTRLYGKGFLP
jgi:hypothetical protein